jgi:hypothetical protein
MRISRRMSPALAGFALFSLFLLAYALVGTVSAHAAGPSTVTFRAVGGPPQYETVVPLTPVTTTTEPVVKYGGSCSGTSAAGALQLGTAGNWGGAWSSKFNDYEVMSIKGKEFPFDENSPANYYWSFWLDNKEASVGVCEAELNSGDQVLFFPACYGASCPAAPNVLAIEAPPTAEVGKPTTVTVLSYPNAGGEPMPAIGVTVTGGGDATAPSTNGQGQTTLIFAGDGKYTIHATGAAEGPPTIPAEAFVCAHEGNDGTCGTQTRGSSTGQAPTGAASSSAAYTGPYAVVAKATGLIDGHTYKRGRAPRVLQGTVDLRAALQDVKLRLTRTQGRKCSYYDGVTERFRAMGCGASHGVYFSVGSHASFSYLLPEVLPPGRYVLDIEATDTAGEHTTLARGTSRIVFYVK